MLEALPGFQFPGLLNPEQQHACGGRRNNRSRRERTYGGQGDRTRWFVVMVIRAAWMLGIKIHLTAFLALTSALFTCSSSTSWALRPCQVEIDLSLFDRIALPCRLGQMRISMSILATFAPCKANILATFFLWNTLTSKKKHARNSAPISTFYNMICMQHGHRHPRKLCNYIPNYVNFLSKQMQNWTTKSGSFSVRANVACHCKHEIWRRNVVYQCFNRQRLCAIAIPFRRWSNLGYQ